MNPYYTHQHREVMDKNAVRMRKAIPRDVGGVYKRNGNYDSDKIACSKMHLVPPVNRQAAVCGGGQPGNELIFNKKLIHDHQYKTKRDIEPSQAVPGMAVKAQIV